MENFSGSRVLITGGNGFIGSHLTSRLVNLNAEVSVISRNPDVYKINELIGKIKFFKVDLKNRNLLNKVVKKINPDVVFHLAADVNVSRDIKLLNESINNNVLGTFNLLNSLNDINYSIFVNTGTCEEYGNGSVPFKENQSPLPVSPYSASKVAITYYCKMLHETQGLPITTVRPFLTYGPKQSNTKMFIPSIIISILEKKNFKMTRGEQTRDFIFVDDVVDGFLNVANNKKAIGEIINIGSGKEYKIIDIAKKIIELTKSDIKLDTSLSYRPGETMHFYCSNKKAKDLLGWKPKIYLEEGLKRTIDWYSSKFKNGELQKWTTKKI